MLVIDQYMVKYIRFLKNNLTVFYKLQNQLNIKVFLLIGIKNNYKYGMKNKIKKSNDNNNDKL